MSLPAGTGIGGVMRHGLRALTVVVAIALPADPPQLRLELTPYFRDLRTVQLMAGERKLTLLVDTGGGATAISPQAAASLACVPYGRDVGHRMTGEPVAFQRCDSVTLSSPGGWAKTFAPIAVFDVAALLPKELPPLDGVLSLDAFAGRVITIDWNAGTIVEWPAGSGPEKGAALPHRAATGENGRYLSIFVPVKATRGLLWLLLDSGNLRGTLIANGAIKEGLLPLGAGGRARLAIGGRPEIELPYTPEALDIDGALGTDFLKRGPVTIDLRAHIIRATTDVR